MKKGTRSIKKLLALFLVVLIGIESFGAVVSDNDGSAFITKAEFDSLKNDFQSQIDQYNTSIDSKIDGAIASYLAGINVLKQAPVVNELLNVKLSTGQYVKDLIWTKISDYRINPNAFTAGDTQFIAQDVKFYASAPFGNDSKEQTIEYRKVASTSEVRIEVKDDNSIVGWGEYAAQITGIAFQFDDLGVYTTANTGFFFPYPETRIAEPMRKVGKISWTCFNHWGNFNAVWQTSGRVGLARPEGSWLMFSETLPSTYEAFDIDGFRVAPLSVAIESALPPAPKATDPDFSIVYDNNHFGNYCYSTGLTKVDIIASTEPDEISFSFGPMAYGENGTYNTEVQGRVHKDLSARWFKLVTYNDLSLEKVDERFGFQSKFKCGLPLTAQNTFLADETLRFDVSDVEESGYLIFYVDQTPSDDWGGNKTNYAVEKWKVTKNNNKQIELNIDAKITGNVFVVWLPDADCKLPTIDIYKIG